MNDSIISLTFQDTISLLNAANKINTKTYTSIEHIEQIINHIKIYNSGDTSTVAWYTLWERISEQPSLSENFMRAFKDFLNWYVIFEKQNLSESFIREIYSTWKNNPNISKNINNIHIQIQNDNNLNNFYKNSFQNINQRHWIIISKHQKLSDEFILEFREMINLPSILQYQTLSENTIKNLMNSLDSLNSYCWTIIMGYQKLSEKFIVENIKYIPLNHILYKKPIQEFSIDNAILILNEILYKFFQQQKIYFRNIDDRINQRQYSHEQRLMMFKSFVNASSYIFIKNIYNDKIVSDIYLNSNGNMEAITDFFFENWGKTNIKIKNHLIQKFELNTQIGLDIIYDISKSKVIDHFKFLYPMKNVYHSRSYHKIIVDNPYT